LAITSKGCRDRRPLLVSAGFFQFPATDHLPEVSDQSNIVFAYRAADARQKSGMFAAFLDSQEFNWRVSPLLSCFPLGF
jgi:hypothetical protein